MSSVLQRARDVLRWRFAPRLFEWEAVGCVCEPAEQPSPPGYPGYRCGCEERRDEVRAARKRNRQQLRRYARVTIADLERAEKEWAEIEKRLPVMIETLATMVAVPNGETIPADQAQCIREHVEDIENELRAHIQAMKGDGA